MFLPRLAVVLAVDTVASLNLTHVLASAGDGGSGLGDVAILLNYGVLGVFTLLWLTGRIEGPKRADRAELRAEAAEARERELQKTLRDEVVPAMLRFTETATRILDRGGR